MNGWLMAALTAAAAVGATVLFWEAVRTAVRNWLADRGLHEGHLVEAFIVLDNVQVAIRNRIFVRTTFGESLVTEQYLELDQIDDPQLLAALEQQGQLRLDILGNKE